MAGELFHVYKQTDGRTDELTVITIHIVCFPNSLLEFNETLIF